MPLYDYDCAACGRRIEVVHGVHAPGPTHCPNCGSGPLRKAISAPAVHFKGSGWAKKERHATAAPGTSKATGESEAVASETETADRPKGHEGGQIDQSDKDVATTKGSGGSGPRDQGGSIGSATASSKAPEIGSATKTTD